MQIFSHGWMGILRNFFDVKEKSWNKNPDRHGWFSISAAPLISASSRELARKTASSNTLPEAGYARSADENQPTVLSWILFSAFFIYTLATSSRVNAENVASFLDERLSERPRFASFVQVGAPSFSGAGTSTIKPKQSKGSERLANEKRCYVFVLINNLKFSAKSPKETLMTTVPLSSQCHL